MKTMKTFALIALTLTTVSNVRAESAAETSKEINAQTQITNGYINNLLDRIGQKQSDANFRVEDYLEQVPANKEKIEKAFVKFESTLEKDVLGKAAYWMDQYNAIYKSPDYSNEQKNILLTQRLNNLKTQFKTLSATYQKALAEVYAIVPINGYSDQLLLSQESGSYDRSKKKVSDSVQVSLVLNNNVKISTTINMVMQLNDNKDKAYDATFITKKGTFNTTGDDFAGLDYDKAHVSSTRSAFYNLSINYREVAKRIGLDDYLLDEAYKKHVYPMVKGSCKSTICLGLRGGDYVNLLGMINKLIDRKIEMKLADGTEVEIVNLKQNIKPILSMISRIDYPEELPFEI